MTQSTHEVPKKETPQALDIKLWNHHVIIQRRYEAIGALNDLLIAIWFLVGSFFFLNNSLMESGTWLFIVGSTQFLIKPLVKLTSLIHLARIHRSMTEASASVT